MSILPYRRCMALALISTCLFPLAGHAADDGAALRAIVDDTVRPLMAQNDVPGMAVALTIDGHSYFFNYGLASKEKNTPVSEATLFELGSVSKTFTATLAAYAQVLGKLSLEEHPGKYMPQLKGSAIDKASVLNLGTYTAGGLPLQFPDEVEDNGWARYFRHWTPDAAPGTQRRYSNPSLALFGQVTAVALKRDFADAVEKMVFAQLGLKHSYVGMPKRAMADYAWGYDKSNKAIHLNPGPLAAPTTGIRSCAADMIRYVQANIDPSALPEPMRRAIDATHVGYFKSGELVQGLGWESYAYPVSVERLLAGNSADMILDANPATPITPPRAPSGPTLFDKTGSTGGFGSYVAFLPEKKLGIVILANKNYPIPERIKAAHAILERVAALAR